jgi:dTDP-4-amino-4,6-dideoxygalactose transaminase
MRIPLTRPYITQEIKDKVCEVLDSGYITEGKVTREFEYSVRDYIGCEHAVAVTSCTTGLEIALRALGIGYGDEVIVPDYTYPATADVVAIVGADIILVDVDPKTMLVDYDALASAITPRTKAIIPVSLFGNPLDYERLRAIKEKHGVYIVEDAACSIGAEYKDVKVGNLADISVFSLHPRKIITTGEGGIITSNNSEWVEWMRSYKRFGLGAQKAGPSANFSRIGTNYKLSDIQAAVGLVQMRHIESLLDRRLQLCRNYLDFLGRQEHVIIPETTAHGKHSRQSFCVFVNNRDEVMTQMRETGIEVQIGTYALHMHKAFNEKQNCRIAGNMSNSRYVFDHCLTLPLYHDLNTDEQEYIVTNLTAIILSED